MANSSDITTHILTVENAKSFLDENGDDRLNGYQIATEEICIRLSNILAKNKDFENLKKELAIFITDREEFSNFLFNNTDDSSNKYCL